MHCETKPEQYHTNGKCVSGVENYIHRTQDFHDTFHKVALEQIAPRRGLEIVTDVFVPPSAAECDDNAHFFVVAEKPGVSRINGTAD